MDNLVKIEVEKEFPLKKFNRFNDEAIYLPDAQIPGIGISLNGITNAELSSFNGDSFTCYMFESSSIPFLIIKFGIASFDCSLTFTPSDNNKSEWSPSNIFGCYLIESGTQVLKSMRHFSVSPNVIENLREIRIEQLKKYSNVQNVQVEINRIYNRYSTADMINYGNRIFSAKNAIRLR